MIFCQHHTKTAISRLNKIEIKFQYILFKQFYNLIVLLMRSQYQFNHFSIQFYLIYHYSRLAFCFSLLRCLLWGKFFTYIFLLVAAALLML
jgi:hypothetical protein